MTFSNKSVADDWQTAFSIEQISDGEATFGYRLLSPAKVEADKQYPLVLFLHGAGERGDDNEAQLKHGMKDFVDRRDEYPCFVIAPQCPTGKRRVEVDWNSESGKGSFQESPSESMKLTMMAVRQLIDAGKVDPKRVYVTGLSMGGYGTWYASVAKDSPFVAAAPICGGGDPSWVERYVDYPLWIFHGDNDSAVAVERSREMVAAIKEAGGNPKYTEYPGVGHDSWTETYANDDFFTWLFAQSSKE